MLTISYILGGTEMNTKDITSILTLLLVVVGGVFVADFLKARGIKV